MDESQKERLLNAAEFAGVRIEKIQWANEREIIANRIRIHALDWGSQEAEQVLLLHGGCLTAHTWDLVCASLSSNYRCLAIDLRGHGDSEWPADTDYRLEAFATDVIELLKSEFKTPPVLIGMSLGGLTAIKVAGSPDVDLRGLVLVDVGPEPRIEGVQQILDFTGDNYELDDIEDFVNHAVAFNPRRDRELLRRSLMHNLRHLPNGRWSWKWDRRRMEGPRLQQLLSDREGLWESVRKIGVPTLVVRGSESQVFLQEDAEKLAATLSNARTAVVSNAGHTVQGDNPSGLLEELRPFLAEVNHVNAGFEGNSN